MTDEEHNALIDEVLDQLYRELPASCRPETLDMYKSARTAIKALKKPVKRWYVRVDLPTQSAAESIREHIADIPLREIDPCFVTIHSEDVVG